VRDTDGTLYVLEDNLRVPSGVSYLLENRLICKRAFADLFERQSILPVDAYTDELYRLLCSIAPEEIEQPCVVVLTPGMYNSAYFEHSFLAQRMGVELVEGRDLVVADDDCVYMRTIAGRDRVDVIYRRVDDLFLDPETFRPDSTLGVPGLMRAWRAGRRHANGPGAGVADDKGGVRGCPTSRYLGGSAHRTCRHRCLYEGERFVLDNINRWCEAGKMERRLHGDRQSGGTGDARCLRCQADPRNWVAQPILNLSTAPTLCEGGIEPRHLDLRPFILTGATSYVTKGGLTRVALREGSLVVNSSQGGGSKDTWVVDLDAPPYYGAPD
jgi:uncharacterized circularly permuted ATP-grasp superfamily protein